MNSTLCTLCSTGGKKAADSTIIPRGTVTCPECDAKKPMSFTEYQKRAWKTAFYPNKGSNPVYPVLGLNGEAGEVADKLKKIMRDHEGEMTRQNRLEIGAELGDVLWYIAAIATELGIDLQAIAEGNNSKLLDRQIRNQLKGSGDNR